MPTTETSLYTVNNGVLGCLSELVAIDTLHVYVGMVPTLTFVLTYNEDSFRK